MQQAWTLYGILYMYLFRSSLASFGLKTKWSHFAETSKCFLPTMCYCTHLTLSQMRSCLPSTLLQRSELRIFFVLHIWYGIYISFFFNEVKNKHQPIMQLMIIYFNNFFKVQYHMFAWKYMNTCSSINLRIYHSFYLHASFFSIIILCKK